MATRSDLPVPTRPAEVERLVREYESATRDAVRIVLIEGPPGAGKGRLVRDVRARIGLEAPLVEGRCDPGRPFSAFAGVVESSLEILAQLGIATPVERDALGCGHGCHDLWYQHVAGGAPAPALPSPDRRLRFFEAVRRLLTILARQRAPIVLLRHLERADRGTVELMAFLAEAPAPWEGHGTGSGGAAALHALVVGTVEEAGPSATWEGAPLAEILRLPTTSSVRIGPLDRDGIARYLSSDEVVDAVLRRSGGLPGRIDRLIATEVSALETSVETDLETHSPSARALLEALAVLGRAASLDELERVLAGPVEPAARAELGRSPLVSRVIVDGATLYDYAESPARSLVRRIIPPDRRRALHQSCAEVCAGTPGREVDAARHALRAGDVPRAVELALVAWPLLLASHAYSTAAQLLESLVAAAAEAPAEVRQRLIELYRVTGETERALTHANAARRDRPEDAAAALTAGELMGRRGDLRGAAKALGEALKLAAASGDPAELAETQIALADLSYRRRELDGAARQAAQALEKAREAGSLPLELDARIVWGHIALATGKLDEALETLRIALDKADRAGLPRHLARALNTIGAAEMAGGHDAAAEHAFSRALQIAREALAEEERAVPLEQLAVLAHARCDYRTARRYYHQAAQVLRAVGNPEKLARVVFHLALLYADLGDPFRARRLCSYAWETTKASRFPAVAADGWHVEGAVELEVGETDRAIEVLDRAVGLAQRHKLPETAFEAGVALARAAHLHGDVGAAQRHLEQIARPGTPQREARLALVHADHARARGEHVLARARAAQEVAERSSNPRLRLEAALRVARALLDEARHDEGESVVEAARELERELTEHVPEECLDLWAERRDARQLKDLEATIGLRQRTMPPPPPGGSGTAPPVLEGGPLGRLIGSSAGMQRVKNLVARIAPSDTTVLLRGESGTGKELVAAALHELSTRASQRFVRVNCAAVVETLLASELFGHERGSFTGAHARKKGWFEVADGGTLFLDEIGDISPKTQAALLRVLQHQEFERVGGTETVRVDVRVIAATNANLEELVRTGEFRQDLYYRLAAVTISIPPLRTRLEDLSALSDHLLERIAADTGTDRKAVSPDALRFLKSHRWPGNVRELENVLRSTALLSETQTLEPRHFRMYAEHLEGEALDFDLGGATPGGRETGLAQLFYDQVRKGETSIYDLRKLLERESISRALTETGGNITRAADLLGMKRPRLSQLIKEYELER